MSVPLLDLKAQWAQIGDEVMAAMQPTLDTAGYILGPPVKQLEEEIAAYCSSEHAVGCASGSDALILALLALGVGPGDEVILPSFTFFATTGAVSRIGATPLFADNDPRNFNILPGEIARLATPRTKACIPVHLFGQACDMDTIMAECRVRGIAVIEDAAQSIGAQYKGRRIGDTGGDIVTLSFYPTKNLGCMGDGGMCVTGDAALAERMRILRNHGMQPKYHHPYIGMNSRLDSLQAAALNVKMKYLESWHEARRQNAADYDAKLAGVAGVTIPYIEPQCQSIYNQYTIRVAGGKRNALAAGFRERGIGFEIYYPVPCHLQECYSSLGMKPGSLPHSEACAKDVISLPIYPELSSAQRDEVVAAIKEILAA